jgi:hypothetical protein
MGQDHTPTGPKGQGPSNSYLKYGSFGLQLLGGIGLAAWLGYRLDLFLALKFPVFMLALALLVLAGMLYQMYKQLNQD